jgi:hypothetical protein
LWILLLPEFTLSLVEENGDSLELLLHLQRGPLSDAVVYQKLFIILQFLTSEGEALLAAGDAWACTQAKRVSDRTKLSTPLLTWQDTLNFLFQVHDGVR